MALRCFLLFAIIFMVAVTAHAQPADTVSVRSDTTLLRTPRPMDVPVDPAPADTSIHLPDAHPTPETLAQFVDPDTLTWRERHSPRKATILSAVLPGAGQIYNRKYWKAPIVWAGLGVSISFIRNNTREYQRYRTAYLALVDDDPSTIDEFNGEYAAQDVRLVMETYQRWRDISYLVTAGIYAINIIDASVDAHFVRFDVSPDLSLKLGPSLPVAAMGGMGLSLQLAVH